MVLVVWVTVVLLVIVVNKATIVVVRVWIVPGAERGYVIGFRISFWLSKISLTLEVVDGDGCQVIERSWQTVVLDDLDQLVGLTYSWEGIWENQEEGEDLRREKRILRKLRHKKLRRKAESWLSSWQVTLSEILILKDDPVLSRRDLSGLWWTLVD